LGLNEVIYFKNKKYCCCRWGGGEMISVQLAAAQLTLLQPLTMYS
jgi:hypothetical protein